MTPAAIRLRKRVLDHNERKRVEKLRDAGHRTSASDQRLSRRSSARLPRAATIFSQSSSRSRSRLGISTAAVLL